MLGMYPEAEATIQKGTQRAESLTRVTVALSSPKDLATEQTAVPLSPQGKKSKSFSLSHSLPLLQFGDEKRLMGHHQALQNLIEDQVSQ